MNKIVLVVRDEQGLEVEAQLLASCKHQMAASLLVDFLIEKLCDMQTSLDDWAQEADQQAEDLREAYENFLILK